MSARAPTASAIALRIAALLPHGGEPVPEDIMRTVVRRRMSPVSDEMFRGAVMLGRARGDFLVGADGMLARRLVDAGCASLPAAPQKSAEGSR